MTDTTDYTTKPEVLEACGFTEEATLDFFAMSEPYKLNGKLWRNPAGMLSTQPTMQELWEGLCKACARCSPRVFCRLCGADDVSIVFPRKPYPGTHTTKTFKVSTYGTLKNAIAAALCFVLQQGKVKHG